MGFWGFCEVDIWGYDSLRSFESGDWVDNEDFEIDSWEMMDSDEEKEFKDDEDDL